MIRRIIIALVVVAIPIAVAVWVPREDEVAAGDVPVADAPGSTGVELTATAGTPSAPYVERWDLTYAEPAGSGPRLTLEIGPAVGKIAPGRLTAAPGADPRALLDRIAAILGDDPAARPAVAPTRALEVSLAQIGEQLSEGQGDVGSTVIAGAFVADPPGEWRVFRLAAGPGGPECFLGLSARGHRAVLLPRSLADGPGLTARFRALLQPATGS